MCLFSDHGVEKHHTNTVYLCSYSSNSLWMTQFSGVITLHTPYCAFSHLADAFIQRELEGRLRTIEAYKIEHQLLCDLVSASATGQGVA